MSSPLATAGGSRYTALNMGSRQFTGLWTQRSPYRDAAVEYLLAKNNSGSRIDSIIDGINREITAKLTCKRRAGKSVWNSQDFPAIQSFDDWRYIQDDAEVIRVLADGADGVIYDASNNAKVSLFTKTSAQTTARFLSVNTELFFGTGDQAKKLVQGAKAWGALKTFTPKQFIVDSNLNLQVAYGGITVNLSSIAIDSNVLTVTLDPADLNLPDNLMWLVGMQFTFAGLTTATFLNGQTVTITAVPQGVPATGSNVFTADFTHGDYASASDTGTVTSGTGVTGAAQPTWGTARYDWTDDGTVQWLCYGPSAENWGIAAPMVRPTTFFQPVPNPYIAWSANTYYMFYKFIVLDGTHCYELTTPGTITGAKPVFNTTTGATTTWGTAEFTCIGLDNFWTAATAFTAGQIITGDVMKLCVQSGTSGSTEPIWPTDEGAKVSEGTNGLLWEIIGGASPPFADQLAVEVPVALAANTKILDPNGFIQSVAATAGFQTSTGKSGGSTPAWSDAPGNSTIDNDLTWVNSGAFAPAGTAATKYYFSYKNSLTGHVSTASQPSADVTNIEGSSVVIQGPSSSDPQVDTIVVWRPAQGQATPIYTDEIPQPRDGGIWSYNDQIPDVSETGGPELNPLIAAPINHENDPPPANITAPIYHLKRDWGIVDNRVVYSGGPDTVVGSGLEAFPPINEIPYLAQPVRLIPITVQNGGILVLTTDGVYIILGLGTASNPFYTTLYYPSVSVSGYNAVAVFNNTAFLMESNKKVSALAFQYPFNPQSGYTEVGFPIGDQFKRVTTGGIDAALYDPATAYVSWCLQSSGETNMFVADGAVGWFPMSLLNAPESGTVWSPRAAITGGTSAVQSIETEPGTYELLMGPAAGAAPGPIYKRNSFSASDDGVSFPAWDVKGVILLCPTGQWVEVAHIAAKSAAYGARPTISVLLGEIEADPAQDRAWDVLSQPTADPPSTRPSRTVYSDRYVLLQNGMEATGDCILVKFDYGTQDEPDELLDWAIFASLHNEREEASAAT